MTNRQWANAMSGYDTYEVTAIHVAQSGRRSERRIASIPGRHGAGLTEARGLADRAAREGAAIVAVQYGGKVVYQKRHG